MTFSLVFWLLFFFYPSSFFFFSFFFENFIDFKIHLEILVEILKLCYSFFHHPFRTSSTSSSRSIPFWTQGNAKTNGPRFCERRKDGGWGGYTRRGRRNMKRSQTSRTGQVWRTSDWWNWGRKTGRRSRRQRTGRTQSEYELSSGMRSNGGRAWPRSPNSTSTGSGRRNSKRKAIWTSTTNFADLRQFPKVILRRVSNNS